jgi:hypothetical protein
MLRVVTLTVLFFAQTGRSTIVIFVLESTAHRTFGCAYYVVSVRGHFDGIRTTFRFRVVDAFFHLAFYTCWHSIHPPIGAILASLGSAYTA